MSYKQFDVILLDNEELYLYVGSRFYSLSEQDKLVYSKTSLPGKVLATVGSLYGQGPNLLEFFKIMYEAEEEVVEELGVKPVKKAAAPKKTPEPPNLGDILDREVMESLIRYIDVSEGRK